MYIYNYGAIGETIRTKIDDYKQHVRGGEKNTDSFSDVLKTYLTRTDTEKKTVSVVGNSDSASTISGSTLLYALQNSDTDTTASTVLSALGFSEWGSGSGADLKSAADSLSLSAETLVKANASGGDSTMAVTEFVSDFNKLMTMLASESTSSAQLYKSAFAAALTASEQQLAAAGITHQNGVISYSGTGEALSDTFLSNIASSASLVSAYASSVVSEDEDSGGISEYYNALMSGLM